MWWTGQVEHQQPPPERINRGEQQLCRRRVVSTIWAFDKIGNFIFRLFEDPSKWKREIGFCERLFKALLIG